MDDALDGTIGEFAAWFADAMGTDPTATVFLQTPDDKFMTVMSVTADSESTRIVTGSKVDGPWTETTRSRVETRQLWADDARCRWSTRLGDLRHEPDVEIVYDDDVEWVPTLPAALKHAVNVSASRMGMSPQATLEMIVAQATRGVRPLR